jgi:hypothetical protein
MAYNSDDLIDLDSDENNFENHYYRNQGER